jgi:hypothetical protein
MSVSDWSDLERKIGRPLLPADRRSIADLNDIPEALIAEARKLHPFDARDLLAYYTMPEDRTYLRDFVENVVFGTQSARRWRRGGVLVPAVSLDDQLRLSRAAILGPLGGPCEVRIVPRLSSWRAGTSREGAPARPWPERNYRSPFPPAATSHLSEPDLEPMPDLAVGIRRWIAGRLARSLKGGAPTSIEELFATAPYELLPIEQWSEDARIATAALLREFKAFGPEDGRIPGFRAPDEWFKDA